MGGPFFLSPAEEDSYRQQLPQAQPEALLVVVMVLGGKNSFTGN